MATQNFVFIPGPTNLPDRLRHATDTQTVNHRAPEFAAHFVPLLEDLKPIFGTTAGETLVFACTGTGDLEAAIVNTLSPGDRILASRYGNFSDRWIQLAQWHQLKIVVEPSSAVALAAVLKNAALFRDPRAGVILTGGNVDQDRLPWMKTA